MTRTEIAQAKLEEGYNCAQAVVTAFADTVDLDPTMALTLTSAFGGGLAHQGHVCGAVNGALVLIGLAHASSEAGMAARAKAYEMGEVFLKAFKARNAFVDCRELIGYDLSTPEGLAAFKDAGGLLNTCTRWVEDAVAILESECSIG